MKLPLAAVICALAVPVAHAEAPPDGALVQQCVAEFQSRQPSDQSHSRVQVVASKVRRGKTQDIVDMQVTQAEGRLLSARCIIRNGKVFDYKGE